MDAMSKQPQFSEMFQKFALAFKTKTIEFFADEDEPTAATSDGEGFPILDSAEEFIPDQKVVIIKPDPITHNSPASPLKQPINTQFAHTLISSLFAAFSSFEASYLQLQTAHVPFDSKAIEVADKSLVSQLQKFSDLRKWYWNFRRNPVFDFDFQIGNCLEAQVQENQNKLRALDVMINRLQSDIDVKDEEVLALRKKLDNIQQSNFRLSKRLSNNNLKPDLGAEILFTIRVFESMLREATRSLHCFTKLLIGLMKKAGWDLELAANSVYPDVHYAKKGHNRYAFLSYVCLGMFREFDFEGFGLDGCGIICNGDSANKVKNSSLKQLVEHASGNPMEFLSRHPSCDFSRFCGQKYEQLIHSAMESSIFRNLDRKEVVLDSWRSLSVFYESFVKMSSSVWLLHKLAHSFNPAVEIFQVERGVDFSMVYMEDVTKRAVIMSGMSRPKVGFTIIPGFKIGRTVIQSQVYLSGIKCTV